MVLWMESHRSIWQYETNHKAYFNSIKMFSTFCASPYNSQIEDTGPSYKTCLRGNSLSLGQARHCLQKAPFIRVLPSPRSEITDGQAQKRMSCFLQTGCVCTGDKRHAILTVGNGRSQASCQPAVVCAELTARASFPRGKQKTKAAALMKFSVFFCFCLFFQVIYAKLLNNQKHHVYDKNRRDLFYHIRRMYEVT